MPSFPSGPVQIVLSDLWEFHVSSIKVSLFLETCRTEDVSVQGTGEKTVLFTFWLLIKLLTLQSLLSVGKDRFVHLHLAFLAHTLCSF